LPCFAFPSPEDSLRLWSDVPDASLCAEISCPESVQFLLQLFQQYKCATQRPMHKDSSAGKQNAFSVQ